MIKNIPTTHHDDKPRGADACATAKEAQPVVWTVRACPTLTPATQQRMWRDPKLVSAILKCWLQLTAQRRNTLWMN